MQWMIQDKDHFLCLICVSKWKRMCLTQTKLNVLFYHIVTDLFEFFLTSMRFPSAVFCSLLFSFNKRLFSFSTFVLFDSFNIYFFFFGDFSIMSFLEKLKFIFIGKHSWWPSVLCSRIPLSSLIESCMGVNLIWGLHVSEMLQYDAVEQK